MYIYMYCILAVVYLFLTVLLLALGSFEIGYWVLIFPFAEACFSATMMQYEHVTMHVKIKIWRRVLLEVLRWSVFTILLYRWFNEYSIIVITTVIWIWCTIEMLQPKITERITYI